MRSQGALSYHNQNNRALDEQSQTWIVNICLVISSVALNPIFIALAAAYFESVKKIKVPFFFYFFILYIFLGFWLRDYGIDFNPSAGDDVPEYFRRIGNEQWQSVKGIVSFFFDHPSAGEPIFYLVNLPISGLDITIELFAFYNYIILAILLSLALRLTLGDFSTLGALVFLFSAAEVSYSFIHLWRQAYAVIFVLLSIFFIRRNDNAFAFLMFILATLSHLVAAYFLMFYVLMFFPRLLLLKKKLPLSLVAIISCVIVISVLGSVVDFLGKRLDIASTLNAYDTVKILVLLIVSSFVYVVLVKRKKQTNDCRFLYFAIVGMAVIALFFGHFMAHRVFAFIVAPFLIYFVLAVAKLFSTRAAYSILASVTVLLALRLAYFSQGAFQASYYNSFFSVFNPIFSVMNLT